MGERGGSKIFSCIYAYSLLRKSSSTTLFLAVLSSIIDPRLSGERVAGCGHKCDREGPAARLSSAAGKMDNVTECR